MGGSWQKESLRLEVPLPWPAWQVRGRMFFEPPGKLDKCGQLHGRLQPASHLATEIGVNHPRRDGLAGTTAAEFQILHAPAAKLAHD